MWGKFLSKYSILFITVEVNILSQKHYWALLLYKGFSVDVFALISAGLSFLGQNFTRSLSQPWVWLSRDWWISHVSVWCWKSQLLAMTLGLKCSAVSEKSSDVCTYTYTTDHFHTVGLRFQIRSPPGMRGWARIRQQGVWELNGEHAPI